MWSQIISTIGFGLSIDGGATWITGKFTDFNIAIDYKNRDILQSKIDVSIKTESINTGIPDRDKDLQSKTFIYTEEFSEITFTSERITRAEDGFIATGILSMRGVQKTVEITFRITYEKENVLGFSIRWNLNRLDYGVGSEFKHTNMPDFLADDVEIEVDFWTRKAKGS